MFVKTRLASALLAAFGSTAAWWSLPAQAQDATTTSPPPAIAPAPAEPPPAATTQRVEVTGSAIRRVADADKPGIRIAAVRGHASTASLISAIKQAEVVLADGEHAAFELLRAGLEVRIALILESLSLDGHFGL